MDTPAETPASEEDDDNGAEVVLIDAEDLPFDTKRAIDRHELLGDAILKRNLLRGAGMDELPMLRQTRDELQRSGYAYEGEPLICYVKPTPAGHRIVLGKHLAPILKPGTQRMLPFDPIPDFDDALEICFEIARRLPPKAHMINVDQ